MKHSFIRIGLMLAIAMLAISVFAQNKVETNTKPAKKERTIALWGHIKDSFTKVGIERTRITLMRPDSSVIDTQTVNYFNGRTNKIDTYYRFDIPARAQKFIVKAEHPDYYPTYVDFDIKYVARNTYFDAPWHFMKKRPRSMEQQEHQLKEAVITATKIKMVYKGDTVIYNADAFNLPKGSMLDDLIKQMPGVVLKDNGEIYMNGKKVDYLMLNGKQFFKGKNNVMLENLPYYTIKNVQFYDKSTDKSKYIGHDVEQKEFVMDVNLKKEYSTGYIANAEVAGGTHDRYMGRLFGLRYSDNTRISFYGNLNNVNEYRRPGRDGDWTPTNSPEGLVDFKRAGMDINIDDKNQRFEENFNVVASLYNVDYQTRTASESFLTSGNSYTRSEDISKQTSAWLYAYNYFTLKKPLFVSMRTSIDYGKSDANNQNRSATFNANPVNFGGTSQILDSIFQPSLNTNLNSMAVNRQSNQSVEYGYNAGINNSIVATKKLSWGDDLELSYDINYRNSMNTSYNLYQLSYLQNNSTDNRNKYTTTPNESYTHNAKVEYTFHLLSNWSYLFYYIYSQSHSSEVNSLYRLDWLNGWGYNSGHSLGDLPSTRDSLFLALDANNSYNKNYLEQTHKEGFRMYYEKKEKDKYTWFNIHLPVLQKNEQLNYQRNILDTCIYLRNFIFQPDMTFIRKTNNFNSEYEFHYSTEVTTPDMVRMINIRDDSNPLAIQLGNSNLKNTIKQSFSASFSNRNPDKQKFFNANIQVSVVDNQIANGFIYNPATGVYTFRPENVDGNWNMNANVGYGSTIDKEKHWIWETSTSWNYNRNVDLTAVSGGTQSSLSKVDNQRTEENLKLNYQLDALKLGVIGKFQWNNATSKRENFQTINAYDFNYGMTAEYKFFKKIDFASDIKMYSRRGYSDSFVNTNNLIWNASVGSSFFNGKMITRLEGFDLLHQLTSVQYYVNGQGRTETWHNNIPSYVMLHLIYRLNVTPKKK
jgi:hypothetical protein